MHIPVFKGLTLLELDYETSDLSNMGLLMMLQQIPCLGSLVFSSVILLPTDLISFMVNQSQKQGLTFEYIIEIGS